MNSLASSIISLQFPSILCSLHVNHLPCPCLPCIFVLFTYVCNGASHIVWTFPNVHVLLLPNALSTFCFSIAPTSTKKGKKQPLQKHICLFCFSTSSGTAREQQRQRDIELLKEITEHKWNSGWNGLEIFGLPCSTWTTSMLVIMQTVFIRWLSWRVSLFGG